jgi:hypothetical protein
VSRKGPEPPGRNRFTGSLSDWTAAGLAENHRGCHIRRPANKIKPTGLSKYLIFPAVSMTSFTSGSKQGFVLGHRKE